MNLSFHLLRKDFKYARFWILATWVVAAMALLFPLLSIEKRGDLAAWLVAFRYGSWLLLFLTVSHVVLLDAPARDSAFFRTLPISFSAWLRSKLLFVLILVLPMALVQSVMLIALGIAPQLGGLVLLFAEDFLSHSVVAGLAMAMAARKPNHARFYASVMIWVGVGIFGIFVFGSIQESSVKKEKWSYSSQYLTMSRFLVVQLWLVIGILAGLMAFSRNRRVGTIGAALVVTLVGSGFVMKFWPVNFVEAMAIPEAEAPRSEWPDTDEMKLEFVEQNFGKRKKSMFSSGDGGYNGTTYRRIIVNSKLTGLAEGWFASSNGYNAELKLSNGKSILTSEQPMGSINEKLLLPSLGIPSAMDVSANYELSAVDIAEFALPDAAEAMEDAKIRGEVIIPFKRPIILARLPLKAGESVKVGNCRYQIISATQIGDEISFKLSLEFPLVKASGGYHSNHHGNTEFLVINQKKRNYLQSGGSGSSGATLGHYGAQHMDFDMSIWEDWSKGEPTKPDTTGWLDDAELLIVGEESGGTFTHAFDFSGISLSNPRGD